MLRAVGMLVVLVGTLSVPLVVSPYGLTIATRSALYAMAALSIALLLGPARLPSLGHAAVFGGGAYAGALVSLHHTNNLFAILVAAALLGGLVGLVFGIATARSGPLMLLILTFAMAELAAAFMVSRFGAFAGGADGLPGIPRPTLAVGAWSIDFWMPRNFYFLVITLLICTVLFLRQVHTSPFGRSLRGIGQNEHRLRALGYVTWRYRVLAFIISGVIAGVAGGLFSAHAGFVGPHLLAWHTSGFILIMAIIGGATTLAGPILGAVVYVAVEQYASAFTARWELIFGAFFIIVVYTMPGGIVPMIRQYLLRFLRN